ncbi:MAG: glutathione binding-like protein, partial [Pseudomonadota bacterium]
QPHFLKLSPNNRIPAILDRETGQALFESGAILLYLAHKTGQFMPQPETGAAGSDGGSAYWSAMQWLMWQMGGLGPMLGQANHFLQFNPGKSDYAEQRYGGEARRLYGVLDKQLADQQWVAGDHYTVADMACWPWTARHDWQRIDLNDYPNVKRWYLEIAARPAVQRGYNVPASKNGAVPMPA